MLFLDALVKSAIDIGGTEIQEARKTHHAAKRVHTVAAAEDQVSSRRQDEQTRNALAGLVHEFARIRYEIAQAMYDPDLPLHLGESLAQANVYLDDCRAGLPENVRSHADVILAAARKAEADCGDFRTLVDTLGERSQYTALSVDREYTEWSNRLSDAERLHEQAWKSLCEAGGVQRDYLPGIEEYGASELRLPRLSDQPFYRAEVATWNAPLGWGKDQRYQEFGRVIAQNYERQSAIAAKEQQGLPRIDFDRYDPNLSFLAATRCTQPAEGGYAIDPVDQRWIDEQKRALHIHSFPAISDELALCVVERATGHPVPRIDEIRGRLSEAPDPVREKERRQALERQALLARPGNEPEIRPAPRLVAWEGEPEEALSAVRARITELAQRQRSLAGTNSVAFSQVEADLRQAETDEVILLGGLGRLADGVRETTAGRLRGDQQDAETELMTARVKGDEVGTERALAKVAIAQRNLAALADSEQMQVLSERDTLEQARAQALLDMQRAGGSDEAYQLAWRAHEEARAALRRLDPPQEVRTQSPRRY